MTELYAPLLGGGLGGDLLQSAAGLLQLGQSVGWGQWGHGGVLDEWLRWLVASQVATASTAAPYVRLGRGASEGFLVALGAAEEHAKAVRLCFYLYYEPSDLTRAHL